MERESLWQEMCLRGYGALFLAAGILAGLSAEAAADWRVERNRDGILIDSRAVEGWQIREFRGQTQINARLSSIVAALHDTSTGKELVDVVAESSVHDRQSDTRYRIYSRMDMPFPLTDRDILNQREIAQDPKTRVVTITDVATTDVLPHMKGLIRIDKARQQWTLSPVAGGGVRVEVVMLSDPAGPIPASLINAMSVDTPFNMLARLKEIVKREPYAQARLAFISDGVAKPEPPASDASKAAPSPAPAANVANPAAAAPVSAEADVKTAAPPDDPYKEYEK